MDPFVIDPGTLRHSVQIQAPSSTRDVVGQPVATWTEVWDTRAAIDNTNSRTFKDSFSSNALASQSTEMLSIRWPGATIDILPGMRVIFGDITYLIQAVDNVQRRNRRLNLACIVVDEGSS